MFHKKRKNKNPKKQKTQIEFVKFIYDPIHGYIGITEPELAIIDTPVFQRLRGVKQLGPAEYVYPTATHTRFSHSLGAMEVASKMFRFLLNFERLRMESASIDLNPDDEELIRLSMLLHDIGHPPFSHALELDDNNKRIDHELLGRKIILKSEIADILKDYGYRPQEIIEILFERKGHELSLIASSVLDADKMDYLARDAHFTGVKHGLPDIDRILMVLTIIEVEGGKTWAVLEKGLPAIEAMIIGRYHMFQSVYYHKTVSAFEALLSDINRRLIDHGLIENPLDIIKDENWDLWSIYDDKYLINRFRMLRKERKIKGALKEKIESFLYRRPPSIVLEGKNRFQRAKHGGKEFNLLPDLNFMILQRFIERIQENTSKTLKNKPELREWTLFYNPRLTMIKEYAEKIDFLYVIPKKQEPLPIVQYEDSMLSDLVERTYTILRLYTKKGSKKFYDPEIEEIKQNIRRYLGKYKVRE